MSAINFFESLNLNGNELQNAVLHPLPSAPSNPQPYQLYTDSTTGMLYQNIGTTAAPNWKPIGAVTSVNGKTGTVELVKSDVGLGNVDNTSDAEKKTAFTGAIADENTGFVTGNQAFEALRLKLDLTGGTITGAVAMSSNKITGLANGEAATDAANVGQLTAGLGGKLDKTGGTLTGPLAMSGSKITGLGSGTDNADAVNVGQMNEAINQASANFRGSFASHAALLAVAWQDTDPDAANYVSNNDYAYVEDDETHSDEAWRYIYVKTGTATGTWTAAYRINEAPLTAAQMAALNSGITAALVAQIGTNQANIAANAAAISGIKDSKTLDSFADVDAALALKAPLASPALTGTPTAPTAAAGTDTTQIATTKFVNEAVSGLIRRTTGTISTSTTSATVNFVGTLLNAYATMGGAMVLVDIAIGNGSVTFSTAQPPTGAVVCVVLAMQ